LDAGCGIGRHAYYAARYGAEVWAVEARQSRLQPKIPGDGARIIQADLNICHFRRRALTWSIRWAYCTICLTRNGLFAICSGLSSPGGEFGMFLYWAPEGQPFKRLLLRAVSALRMLTVRMPYWLLYPLSYVAAFLVWTWFVWPYRAFKRIPTRAGVGNLLPLRHYSRYPFRTCVNDQSVAHRLSNSSSRADWKSKTCSPNFGWVACGRKPVSTDVAA
jgi:hypothetical protein